MSCWVLLIFVSWSLKYSNCFCSISSCVQTYIFSIWKLSWVQLIDWTKATLPLSITFTKILWAYVDFLFTLMFPTWCWDWIPKTLPIAVGFGWFDVHCGMRILIAFIKFCCVAYLGIGFEIVGCLLYVVKLAFELENVGWNVRLYWSAIIPRVLSPTRAKRKVC